MSLKQIRFGIVGLDGHGPVFAEQVNGRSATVEHTRVSAAMPVSSVMVSRAVLADNVSRTKELGVAIVHEPQELVRQVDGVLILHDDGSIHLDLVRLFAPFGKPLFVDKPLESSVDRAKELARVCRSHNCSVFSASSLRFSIEMQRILNTAGDDDVCSALTYAPFKHTATMPGWIYYAIHAVEPLFELMGGGCREVRSVESEFGPLAIGRWADGRLGFAKANREGPHDYGMTVWRQADTETTIVEAGRLYPELLARIRSFVATGSPPVAIEQSIEVIAFLSAANESMAADGRPVALA